MPDLAWFTGRQLCVLAAHVQPLVADHPLYTQRFALYVGRRCRASTIRDVAADLRLD